MAKFARPRGRVKWMAGKVMRIKAGGALIPRIVGQMR